MCSQATHGSSGPQKALRPTLCRACLAGPESIRNRHAKTALLTSCKEFGLFAALSGGSGDGKESTSQSRVEGLAS